MEQNTSATTNAETEEQKCSKQTLEKMKKSELESTLKAKGMPKSGDKANLVERLIGSAVAESISGTQESHSKIVGNESRKEKVQLQWIPLNADKDNPIVIDSDEDESPSAACSPADPSLQSQRLSTRKKERFNFKEKIVRPKFTGMRKIWKKSRRGHLLLGKNRAPLFESIECTRGFANSKFADKSKLSLDSEPIDWFFSFARRDTDKNDINGFSLKCLAFFSTTKVALAQSK